MGSDVRVPRRILVYVTATAALAAAGTVVGWDAPLEGAFWFWLFACFVGELSWVRLPVGQATVSMASCFQFAALFVLPPGQVMLVAALSSALAETLVLRKPPLRAVFNAGQGALAVGAASATILLMAPDAGVRELVYGVRLLPLIVAATVYFAVNTGAVALAIAMSERVPFASAWRRNFGQTRTLLVNTALFTLGALLASHYANNGMIGTLLVTAPLVAAQAWARRAGRQATDTAAAERKAA